MENSSTINLAYLHYLHWLTLGFLGWDSTFKRNSTNFKQKSIPLLTIKVLAFRRLFYSNKFILPEAEAFVKRDYISKHLSNWSLVLSVTLLEVYKISEKKKKLHEDCKRIKLCLASVIVQVFWTHIKQLLKFLYIAIQITSTGFCQKISWKWSES